jgi:hypothetical protein
LFPHGSRSSDLIALDQAYQEQFANRLTFTIPAQAIALRTSGKIVINYIAPAFAALCHMIDTQIRNSSFAGWAFAPSAPVRLDIKIYQPIVIAGTSQTAEIQLKNIGTANWDANTKLVALPHEGGNPFYDPSWIASNRIVGAANTPLGAQIPFALLWVYPQLQGAIKSNLPLFKKEICGFQSREIDIFGSRSMYAFL